MQTSVHKQRSNDGRRECLERRHEEIRSGEERRDKINRRDDMIAVMDPEDRINGERRNEQQRSESRRKNIRRSGRDRRDN
ncbi:MAG: hypothetical protein H8E36_04090 [Rhodospirillaceae bacterium]|nr:hypothetical protein [Rhodospirillaceae bacterium]MBL6930997.1 hypothetical protein [Rhodospirillales bacterium]MBL6942662.1 hypothetical protein [Rhodospirillales bacterium]